MSRSGIAVALCGLTGLYLAHILYVWHIGPLNRRHSDSFWVFFVLSGVVAAALIRSILVVRRGGRFRGAAILSLLLLGVGILGSVFGQKSIVIREHHWPFILLEMSMGVVAIITLFQMAVLTASEMDK